MQLARRGFLRLISALPAAFAVFRSLPVQAAPVSETPKHTFESIRAQCRAIVRQYPGSRVIGMGSAAIDCYEAGLIATYGVVEASVTQRPYVFGYKRVVVVPSLGPWDVAAEVDIPTAQQWWDASR